jgi:very-short-patch-repair endonuclease
MATSVITGQKVDEKIYNVAKHMRSGPTPQEKRLWDHLRAGKLAGLHFRRQQVIDQFIVDFYNHSAELVIELDGSVHDDPTQAEYDHERKSFLEEKGLSVIRFRNSEIDQHLEEVLEKIKSECKKKLLSNKDN